MTDTTKEAVDRLLGGVTPGPWQAVQKTEEDDHVVGFDFFLYSPTYGCVGYWTGHKPNHKDERWCLTEADARFIAASRELVPALLAEREALTAEVARLTAALDAGDALAEQAAHVFAGSKVSQMNIHASANALGPLVDAWRAAHAARREGGV